MVEAEAALPPSVKFIAVFLFEFIDFFRLIPLF